MERHNTVSYLKQGDLMLGGIFTIHWYDKEDNSCTQIRPLREMFRVEAMAYAIDQINKRNDVLPGYTMGFQILDDCGTEASSLAAVLHFVPGDIHKDPKLDECECPGLEDKTKIIGIIGPPLSTNAIPTSKLLHLFHKPQISHAATSDELSNKDIHTYFLRTVPPESQRTLAIVELLLQFNWTYIFTLNSAENYGRNAISNFTTDAINHHICIAARLEISSSVNTDDDVDKLVSGMISNPHARVVVMFSLTREADMLFAALKRANADKMFTFITTDREALDLGQDGHASAASGGLFVGTIKKAVDGLEEHFNSFSPKDHIENPWFLEYYSHYFNCSDRTSNCNDSFHIRESRTYAASVVDAVYAYAGALHRMQNESCQDNNCDKFMEDAMNGDKLLRYLLNNTFDGVNGKTRFNSRGDIVAQHPLFVLQFVNDKYELVNVGNVDTVNHVVNINGSINWNTGHSPPESRCGEPCQPGEVATFRKDGCCWDCWTCYANEIVNENSSKCIECDEGFWPNKDITTCEKILPTHLQWTSGVAICLLTFATFGECVVVFIIVYYIKYRRHLVIKASSRELSAILLCGISVSFGIIFSFIAKPSVSSCFVNRLGFMLCFTIIYAPILSRANRIYRIFSAASNSAKPPVMISPCSQVVLTLLLILGQLVITLIWVMLRPPGPVEMVPVRTQKRVELSCNITEGEMISSVCYNLLLLIMCCFYAFKTRNVPDNYNETRHIGWTVYTVLVIWLAFIPTYFAIKDAILKVVILSMAIIINAWDNLLFMFLPKILTVTRTTTAAPSNATAPPTSAMVSGSG
uniref:Metabotropic glutamate receptor 3-like n=1 Tax=Saccoglossus kowalevskii TaxID=10224 RepID=A0ABM0M7T9_SACKO|nr:PREDICTED: metabotropic glutamate receptor 3-like [Saccoglossus kowalevskii]